MKIQKNTIFVICLLWGAVLFAGCGKDDNAVKSSTMPVIKAEENIGENEKSNGLTEFDAFEGIYPSFSGTSPDGTASIVYKNKTNPMRYFYSIEPHSNLRNGDVVIISIDDDDPEKTANENGYTLIETEKEFVVEGLDYYVETIDEITDEMQNKMNEWATASIKADMSKQVIEVSLKDCEIIGYYLLSKVTDSYDLNNHCYSVYKITITIIDQEVSYYYCARFDNIIIKGDGSCKVTGGSGITLDGFYENDYRIQGCQTLDEVYEECIDDWCWDTENYKLETNMTK
ncbi:MAG: hypothetical protein HDR19_02025 [Lachnospiraceae bacterium]|nr:hypothetical protein [Lachnospiraceae bacterium]